MHEQGFRSELGWGLLVTRATACKHVRKVRLFSDASLKAHKQKIHGAWNATIQRFWVRFSVEGFTPEGALGRGAGTEQNT